MSLTQEFRVVALALGATALACICASPARAQEARTQELTQARFVLSPSPTPPAADAGQAITLPDDWEERRPQVTGTAWYVLDWTPPAGRAPVGAIYLTGTTMPVEVYVNGSLIGATGMLHGPRPRSWQQSQLYVIPDYVMLPGANRIALRVHENVAGSGGMGPVLAGPEPALRERAFRDLVVHTLGPVVVSVTIIVLGIFIIVLWMRRRDPTYGLFGVAAVLWGVHTGLSLAASPLLPYPHWTIAWTSLYVLFVGLLCLFCLRFAEFDWPWFRRLIIGFVIAVPIALYAAFWLGVGQTGTVVARLAAIIVVLIALTAVARYALRRRDAESMLLLLAGAVSFAFAVHDWYIVQYGSEIRPVMLVPYAGLAFLMLVGWILTDRFVRALNEYESLNVTLERRVAEKSVALERQLDETRAARDAAETANRAKTRFLAAASHDLRQPLHALGLFAARLSDRTRDAEDSALVHRISTSVASLESLFSALLDISKLEAGVVAAEARAIALDPLFARLANDFAPEALDKGLKLAVVPTTRAVRSDPVLLERILRNLLANAVRYTQHGGVVMGARPRGRQVAIEVWDSGPGIAAENLDRVFEEFYQVGNPERDRARGLGLGLAIVRRLARLLGHQVSVSSRTGRGSVFRLLATAVPIDQVPPSTVTRPPADPLNGRRVLVIDDDEPIRESMRQTLTAWGCVPVVAADADDAVAKLRGAEPPDAMLVDFRLPDRRDGIAAIAQVRAAIGASVPAIVVSGESSSEELARLKAAGFMVMHKPVAPAKLRAALSYLLAATAPG
ncbi:MAG: ATP-binding protein [Burkholderiales bacterium]